MIDAMHGHKWAKCMVRGCLWEGSLRSSWDEARKDDNEHMSTKHPRLRGVCRCDSVHCSDCRARRAARATARRTAARKGATRR